MSTFNAVASGIGSIAEKFARSIEPSIVKDDVVAGFKAVHKQSFGLDAAPAPKLAM